MNIKINKKLGVLILSSVIVSGCNKDVPENSLIPSEAPVSEAPKDNKQSDKLESAEYELKEIYPSLKLKEPVALVYDGDKNINIVERGGLIHTASDEAPEDPSVLIDLTDIVDTSGQEMGLLGLAFHPDYKENGYFFVNYTKEDKTFISRFERKGVEPVDLKTEKVILTYDQPYKNHNGGTLQFGKDGFLYIATGDGGSSGDPKGNAQNLESYLGKILRIDIDSKDKDYDIPKDNPFIDDEKALGEIYAYGLRNPWKFSFDKERDLLIAADVGQGKIEEIDIIEKGKNYGWNILEGSKDYSGKKEDLKDHVLPIFEYEHDEGKSITGGETYYGKLNPSLNGLYIYGDFISGKIWGLKINQDNTVENHELLDTDKMISSFGLDGDGEIIVVDFNGKLYKLEEK